MEQNKNLGFWNKYKAVPEKAMKSFNNGKFEGTDINTMWRFKCLTETYGQCGFGWYYTIKERQIYEVGNGDVFAFVEIELYLKNPENGEWSKPIIGNGGNKIARATASGKISTSDEAYKMAVTDAIGNACRNLGIGADVYWANDKTKYTEQGATPEQIACIRELKVIEENVCRKFKIDSIEQLTSSEAQWVIETKKKSMEE